MAHEISMVYNRDFSNLSPGNSIRKKRYHLFSIFTKLATDYPICWSFLMLWETFLREYHLFSCLLLSGFLSTPRLTGTRIIWRMDFICHMPIPLTKLYLIRILTGPIIIIKLNYCCSISLAILSLQWFWVSFLVSFFMLLHYFLSNHIFIPNLWRNTIRFSIITLLQHNSLNIFVSFILPLTLKSLLIVCF